MGEADMQLHKMGEIHPPKRLLTLLLFSWWTFLYFILQISAPFAGFILPLNCFQKRNFD